MSQLKVEFEARTGGAWPVNIGQVFTTLQRLVRDGLVEPVPLVEPVLHAEPVTPGGPAAHGGSAEPERFRLTPAGSAEAAAWWSRPVERGAPARDELAIKLALAVTAHGVDVRRVVQAQRTETMRALHDYTRLKVTGRGAAAAGDQQPARGMPDDLAWSLVLDNLIFAAEAEIRWLDHVEARVAMAAAEHASGMATAQGAVATRIAPTPMPASTPTSTPTSNALPSSTPSPHPTSTHGARR